MSAGEDIERLDKLKSQRANFDHLFQQSKDLIWPDGGDFNTRRSPGENTTRKIYDDTATLSVEKFAAAMEAFLTPRTQIWHRIRASDERLNKSPRVKAFFENGNDVILKMRNSPRARFYGQAHSIWKSLGTIGNGCMFVDEAKTGGSRYKFIPVGQAWIEMSFEDVADTIYYEYELTAKAAHQKWGDDAPEMVKKALEKNSLDTHKYVHLVRPNPNADPERADAEGMAFEAFDIAVDDKEYIGEKGGFEEFPYLWTRYTVNPAEIYGRGPGMLVLNSIKTLQEMQKTFLRAGHKVADPPLLVAHDGRLGRGSKRIRVAPGGLNFGAVNDQGRPLVVPLQTGARLDINMEMANQERERIREAMLNDLFDLYARDRVQMTATEVLERAKERGQLLTPVVGRQQSEFLGPLIEREIKIAQRQGLLGPLPEELVEAQGEYEIEYESDATRMQKSDEIAAFSRLQEVIAPLVAANPQLLAKFKGEQVIEHYSDDLGVPSSLINTEEEMKPIHDAQAKAAQTEQLNATIPAAAGAARDLAAVA